MSELRGVVAHGDDGVGFHFLGVLKHALEGVGTGLLAYLLVGGDVAAEHLGHAAAAALPDGLGPDDDAPDHSQVRRDAIARDLVPRCHDDLMFFVFCHRTPGLTPRAGALYALRGNCTAGVWALPPKKRGGGGIDLRG